MLIFLVYQRLLVEHIKNKYKVHIDSYMASQGEDYSNMSYSYTSFGHNGKNENNLQQIMHLK